MKLSSSGSQKYIPFCWSIFPGTFLIFEQCVLTFESPLPKTYLVNFESPTMANYSDGEIVGIVLGVLIGVPLVLFLMLYALKRWMQGPTKGSDNPKKLDGKLVVITGANTGIGKNYSYRFG